MTPHAVHRNAVSVCGSAAASGDLDAWYAQGHAELADEVADLDAFHQAVDTLVVEGGWPRPYAMAVWYVLRKEHSTPRVTLRDHWPAFRGEISQLIELTRKHYPALLA